MKLATTIIASSFLVLTLCLSSQSACAQVSGPYSTSPYWDSLQPQPVIQAPVAPNYYPYVIARPADRTWLQQLPMEARPNRPLHFWGNTVRRRSEPAYSPFSARAISGLVRR